MLFQIKKAQLEHIFLLTDFADVRRSVGEREVQRE